jgi:DNA-binding transcriptional LysR family regulator
MGDLQDSSLTARKIGQSPRAVLASPGYFENHGEPASPADLGLHQAVVYDLRSGGTVWNFSQGTNQSAVTIKGRIRLTAAEGVREAVFAGMGLAVASEWMFAPELASGKVRRVLQDWDLPPIDLWAVFPSGRTASSKARTLADFIRRELASEFSTDDDGGAD